MREVSMKFGRLVVFIRHDSAEIWRFKYGLKLGIGTLKVMTSTGVFVCVVCAFILPTRARNNGTWDRRRIVNKMR